MKIIDRRRQYFLAATLTVAASLSGVAPGLAADRVPSGTLTIARPWDPGTMDPQMHRQRYAQIVSTVLRDKLFLRTPPEMDLRPLLAESITQIDDTTYDTRLREGIRFHNGDELTAEDVAYTYRRLWDPATKSPRANMGNMANVESVEVIDRYTNRWKTKVPFGPAMQAAEDMHLSGQEILSKAT